jgi:hypothetical protein
MRIAAICLCLLVLSACAPAEVRNELNWSSVPLEGMHLRLVSPKASGTSEDLHFEKGGNLAVDYCSKDYCTGPATVWKIENNRLKTGFAPTEGDVLLEYAVDKIVMRAADGTIRTYAIVPKVP